MCEYHRRAMHTLTKYCYYQFNEQFYYSLNKFLEAHEHISFPSPKWEAEANNLVVVNQFR